MIDGKQFRFIIYLLINRVDYDPQMAVGVSFAWERRAFKLVVQLIVWQPGRDRFPSTVIDIISSSLLQIEFPSFSRESSWSVCHRDKKGTRSVTIVDHK